MAKAKTLHKRTCASTGCPVEFETSQPNKLYHDRACKKRANNCAARPETVTDRLIAFKGTRACSICKSSATGKRFAFFWNTNDGEIENFAAALLLCARCWKKHCATRLGQEKLMYEAEHFAELKIFQQSMEDNPRCADQLYDLRSAGMSIVDLEDIAEDKSKLKRAPDRQLSAADELRFSVSRLSELAPSERIAYAQAHPRDLERLSEKEKDLVGTLLCHASREQLREEAPITSDLRADRNSSGPSLAGGYPVEQRIPLPLVRLSQELVAHSFGSNAEGIIQLQILRLSGEDWTSLGRALAAREVNLDDDGLADDRTIYGLLLGDLPQPISQTTGRQLAA